MPRAFLALLTLALSLRLSAEVGDWRVFAAYHNAEHVAEVGGLLFVLSDGGLYSYDPEDTSVETYDKADGLSDHAIFAMCACQETDELVIVYENGNIDLLSPDGSLFNMPDIKTSSLSDKTINDILVQEGWLYVCTNSGLVCVDIAGRYFGNTYNWGLGVQSVALIDGIFYAATTDYGLYTADTAENLLDPANWTYVRNNAGLKHLMAYGETLFFVSTNLNCFTNLTTGSYKRVADRVDNVSISGDEFFAYSSTSGQVLVVEEDGTYAAYTDTIGVSEMISYGSGHWAACGEKGLQAVQFTDDGHLAVTTGSIIPNSPRRNYAYQLKMEDGERLLVAGGWANYSNSTKREGTVMRYEDGTWTSFDEDAAIATRASNCYYDVVDILQDPLDSEHHFAAAHHAGLYEFRSGELVAYYAEDNSPLVSALAKGSANESLYVRVAGLAFDDDHNLWMLNCETDTIIRILQDDGSWASLYLAEIEGHPTLDHILFDQRGWAWINDRRSTSTVSAGFLVLDTNGTPTYQGDDVWKLVTSFANQDGTTYSPTLCNCLCEDLNGYIWVGNDRGLFVTYAPSTVFDDDFYLTQVKVPRDDGSGLADYLLSDVTIKCICIDGGNRKWVGTSGSGVFLLSDDGLETIEQFTTENSPLPSDDIYDIAINPQTGEVFIATAEGLASYMGDATDPVDEMDKDLVKVYPNPVRPEYAGDIHIRGLAFNSDVKIVNAAGRLVNTGTSTGGSYTWDGRLASGKQCASGVYYVLATDEAGENGVVAKFLMIRE